VIRLHVHTCWQSPGPRRPAVWPAARGHFTSPGAVPCPVAAILRWVG